MPGRSPIKFVFGTRTLSKCVSTTGTQRMPILSSIFLTVKPGVPFSTTMALMRRDFEVGSVTQKTE